MKIGILNCSDIARRRTIPALKSISGFDITSVCSRNLDKAKSFAKEFEIRTFTDNPEDMIPYIDAVYISSPPSEHFKWIHFFLDSGKHVFCEKSLTTSKRDTEYLINFAKDRGLIIMENYAFQWHPQWQWIKEKIDSKELGNILTVRASFEFPLRPNPDEDFRYNVDLGGGALLDCGGYPLMLFNLMTNDKSEIEMISHRTLRDDLDIHGTALLNDGEISFFLSWGMESFYRCDLEIVGTKGKITSPKIFTPKADEIVRLTYERHGKETEYHHFSSDQFANILQEFKRCIEEKDSNHHIKVIRQSHLQNHAKITSIRTFID